MPPRAIILYTTISPAPVYGIIETHLGRGIVGGSIASLEAQGQRAAQLAFLVALLAQNRRRRLAEQGSSGIEPVRVNGV